MRVFSSQNPFRIATIDTVNWEIERLLRSTQIAPLLQAAIRSSGLELQGWGLERVYSRPDGETSARFSVEASGLELTLVASTRMLREADRARLGAIRCESAAGTLHIWAHPTDPELPGLRIVEDDVQLTARLAQLLGTELRIEQSQMLVLRPLRRAVYRMVVNSDRGLRTLFLKIVRPRKMDQLIARHRACALVPPTADLGDGILAVDQAAGIAMTQLLHFPSSPAPGVRISPETVLSALDSITGEALRLPPRTPPSGRFTRFIDALVAHGAQRRRVQSLAESIQRQIDLSLPASETCHGDFHPANLFLTEDGLRPTALIDADTVGPGRRRDDIAMMLAHLLALPSFDATGYRTAADTARALWQETASRSAADLAARTAASLLCLAPGARSAGQLSYYITAAENLISTATIPVIDPLGM